MRHQDIREGDTLKLKRDNAYGFGTRLVTVAAIRYPNGYKTPWIYSGEKNDLGHPEAFRPSGFSGRA